MDSFDRDGGGEREEGRREEERGKERRREEERGGEREPRKKCRFSHSSPPLPL